MPRAKVQTETYPEIENIKEDLSSLKSNVFELTQAVKEDGVVKTENLKDAAAERYATLRAKGMQQAAKAEEQVKAKPLQSVAGAFAAGLLLSMFMRRR